MDYKKAIKAVWKNKLLILLPLIAICVLIDTVEITYNTPIIQMPVTGLIFIGVLLVIESAYAAKTIYKTYEIIRKDYLIMFDKYTDE